MTDRVTIVPYDPDWPRRFDEERRALAAMFAGSEATIEHVGSTAVPDLGAKPVIDIMVGVPVLVEVERHIPALEAAGYEYVQEYERQLPDRRYFRKPRLGPRAFHVHCVVTGSDLWIRHLAFRDHLRAHPESAAAYYNLKRELAMRVSRGNTLRPRAPSSKVFSHLPCAIGRGSSGRPNTAVNRTAADKGSDRPSVNATFHHVLLASPGRVLAGRHVYGWQIDPAR